MFSEHVLFAGHWWLSPPHARMFTDHLLTLRIGKLRLGLSGTQMLLAAVRGHCPHSVGRQQGTRSWPAPSTLCPSCWPWPLPHHGPCGPAVGVHLSRLCVFPFARLLSPRPTVSSSRANVLGTNTPNTGRGVQHRGSGLVLCDMTRQMGLGTRNHVRRPILSWRGDSAQSMSCFSAEMGAGLGCY